MSTHSHYFLCLLTIIWLLGSQSHGMNFQQAFQSQDLSALRATTVQPSRCPEGPDFTHQFPPLHMGQRLLLKLSPSLSKRPLPPGFSSDVLAGWNSWGQVSTSHVFFQNFSFSPAWKKLFDANIQKTQDQQRERESGQEGWGGRAGTGSETSCRGGGRWERDQTLRRNKGGEWESSGVGLSVLVWIRDGVYRAEDLGCLVRETYTRTRCGTDRRTQQSRDFSGGEKERREGSDREIETGAGQECLGEGREVTEIGTFWIQKWWTWRREEKEI